MIFVREFLKKKAILMPLDHINFALVQSNLKKLIFNIWMQLNKLNCSILFLLAI